MISAIVAFLAGVVFAIGLGISGMTDPANVLGFLDVTGSVRDWNPGLMFVMGGAVLLYLPVYFLVYVRNGSRAVLTGKVHLYASGSVTRRMVTGAILFGIGWGMAGFCPGPALTALATLKTEVIAFVAAMAAGAATWHYRDSDSF